MNRIESSACVRGGACGLLADSCGLARPELARRDTDHALEVMRKVALVREANARRDLDQREVAVLPEQLLRTLHATGDHVLVRRLSRRDLELPREVIRAEVRDRRHLLQAQAGVEVFLDVLGDRAELRSRERSVSPARGLTRGYDVS